MDQSLITILTDTPLTLKNLPHRIVQSLAAQINIFFYFLTHSPKFLPDAEIEEAVASLRRGFEQLNIQYQINPWEKKVSAAVAVIGSFEGLTWALGQKKAGGIKKLATDRKVVDAAIDRVIVPTETVKAEWIQSDQYFQKAAVWNAGVADTGAGKKSGDTCIVYSRNTDEKLFSHIMEVLWEHKVTIIVSNYGQFRSHEYVSLLKQAKFIIYLDDFKSQSLGLYEAWMAGVPSLIHGNGIEKIPAECALTFTGADDFESKLLEFIEHYNGFNPRPYALAHHTDAVSAGNFRRIIVD